MMTQRSLSVQFESNQARKSKLSRKINVYTMRTFPTASKSPCRRIRRVPVTYDPYFTPKKPTAKMWPSLRDITQTHLRRGGGGLSILKTRFTVRMVPGCFRLTLLHLVINFSFLCSSELILAGIQRRNKPL